MRGSSLSRLDREEDMGELEKEVVDLDCACVLCAPLQKVSP